MRPTRATQRPASRQPARLGAASGCGWVSSSSRWCSRCSAAGWCSCRASTRTSYAAMAAAEGMVRSPPGRARRHPGPQRHSRSPTRSTGDGGRRPDDDPGQGAGAREVPRQPARPRLLHHPQEAAHAGQPLRVHRAPGARHARPPTRSRPPTRTASRGSPPGPTRSATTRPATSPPTWSASWAPTSRSPAWSATFDTLLAGTDGSARYEVGDGNRIPLGESTIKPAVNGTTCTPRSTSTSSGTPSGCCARPSRTPAPTRASPS